MPDKSLIALMSDLSRLLHHRSSTPRSEALSKAHSKIRAYAEVRHLPEDWCDKVLMLFLSEQHAHVAA